MLVLTRRIGESLVIDSKVQVTVLSRKGNEVRLGIQAPRSIAVDRLEVYERRLQEAEETTRTAVNRDGEEILAGMDWGAA